MEFSRGDIIEVPEDNNLVGWCGVIGIITGRKGNTYQFKPLFGGTPALYHMMTQFDANSAVGQVAQRGANGTV